MGQALGQGGMLGLLAVAGLAWGFARVLDAPRWAGRAILLAVVLVMLASQIALPPEAPFRQSVAGAIRALVFLAIAALPVLGYRALLRRLRARGSPVSAPASPAPVTGRTALVPEAEALAADLAAALAEAAPERFGLIHRAADGSLAAGAVVTLDTGVATAAPVWWREDADPVTVIRPLLAAMGSEAAARGAVALTIGTRTHRIAETLRAEGFAETATVPGAPASCWKPLP